LRQHEPVADAEIRLGERARRHLDDGERAEGARDAAGRNGSPDFHHGAVLAGEHDVDRESHEEGVYEVRRRNHERVARRQPRTTEQTAFPCGTVERRFDRRGDRSARPHVGESMIRRRIPEER
jgi:hypothetical protein